METLQPIKPATPIPVSQPANPPKPAVPGDPVIKGAIPETEALKGGEGAKMNVISLGTLGNGSVTGSSVAIGSLIEGKLAVELMDAVIPSLLVILFHALKIALKKTDFQLTAKEKETIAPLMQKCMDTILVNFNNPWITLLITLGIIYGGKGLEKGGVAWLDRIAAGKEAKPEPMAPGKAEKPSMPSAAEVEATVLGNWTEEDVKRVIKKRRLGRNEAISYLEKNWTKKGGVIYPDVKL